MEILPERYFGPCIALSVIIVVTANVRADTMGLWSFDTIADVVDGPTGERFFDRSGNGLHLTKASQYGSVGLSSSVPSLAPTGSLSLLNSNGRAIDTPASELLSIGHTNELTVEFRYKPRANNTISYIAAQPDGDNAWAIYQTVPDINGKFAIEFWTRNDVGIIRKLTTAKHYDDATDWFHFAATVNDAGIARLYEDGTPIASGSGFTGFAPLNGAVRVGSANPSTNWTNSFLMDDLRISDMALPPGDGTGVGELAWSASLSEAPDLAPRPPDFGRYWVRNHGFVISSWGVTAHMSDYKEARFNSALSNLNGLNALAAESQIDAHYLGSLEMTLLDDQAHTVVHTALNAGVTAFLLRDEIAMQEIGGIADVADQIRSINSDTLLIAGLPGSTPTAADNIISSIQPDAIIHGRYPFQGTSTATDDWGLMLQDVSLVRGSALLHDVLYFSYVQSFDDQVSSANAPDDRRRLPTESELRAELFSKLSAGVKGLVYFVFQDGPKEDIALMDPSGNKSPLYQPAADANLEVANLGKSLRFLESTDWRFLGGGVSPTPPHMTDWDSAAGNGLVDVVAIDGPAMELKDGVLGYFTDEDGGEYFMLVNTNHGDSLDAAAASADFTLIFDPAIDTVWRLNRLSGLVERLDLTNHTLHLTLPGGTGDLFKFGDGLFAGLPVTGDLNGDGFVGIADLNVILGNWNQNVTAGDPLLGDPSGDGFVGIEDLNLVLSNWNAGQPADSEYVPEPALTIVCLMLSLLHSRVTRRGHTL